MALLPVLLLVLALLSFLFTFGTGVELIRFISLRALFAQQPTGAGAPQHRADAAPRYEWSSLDYSQYSILHPLMMDVGLIALFILQHSLMATERVKRWTSSCLGVLQRSFYVFCTALALQPLRKEKKVPAEEKFNFRDFWEASLVARFLPRLLMRYWQPVQDGPTLWNAHTEPWDTWVPLICFILHFVSWLIIFSIILIFDYAELMGIKQVYYHCLGMGDPLAVKSSNAVRLYSHLRHPVYLEFLLLLWGVPCLSLDRLVLAGLFTAYLTCAHSLDQQDYFYLRAQLDKKFQVFSREEAAYGDLLSYNGPSAYKEN